MPLVAVGQRPEGSSKYEPAAATVYDMYAAQTELQTWQGRAAFEVHQAVPDCKANSQ